MTTGPIAPAGKGIFSEPIDEITLSVPGVPGAVVDSLRVH